MLEHLEKKLETEVSQLLDHHFQVLNNNLEKDLAKLGWPVEE